MLVLQEFYTPSSYKVAERLSHGVSIFKCVVRWLNILFHFFTQDISGCDKKSSRKSKCNSLYDVDVLYQRYGKIWAFGFIFISLKVPSVMCRFTRISPHLYSRYVNSHLALPAFASWGSNHRQIFERISTNYQPHGLILKQAFIEILCCIISLIESFCVFYDQMFHDPY